MAWQAIFAAGSFLLNESARQQARKQADFNYRSAEISATSENIQNTENEIDALIAQTKALSTLRLQYGATGISGNSGRANARARLYSDFSRKYKQFDINSTLIDARLNIALHQRNTTRANINRQRLVEGLKIASSATSGYQQQQKINAEQQAEKLGLEQDAYNRLNDPFANLKQRINQNEVNDLYATPNATNIKNIQDQANTDYRLANPFRVLQSKINMQSVNDLYNPAKSVAVKKTSTFVRPVPK